MADTRPKYTTVARAKNYWMSTQALSIMLNALGEPNRIQASAASGARFFCHFEDIGDADAESVFGFDVGHNFPSWPLSISPTYFSTNKAVYPHISIPRDDNGNAQAMVVFPTEVLDLWGYATYTEPMKNEDGNYIDEYGNVVTRAADAATAYIRKKKSGSTTIDDDPIGSDDYYYIFLQGMITSSGDAGTTARRWNPMYATGLLNTAESWGEVITIEQLAKEMKKKVDVDWFQRIFTIHGTERKRVINSYDADGNPVYAKDANGNYIYSGTSTKRDVKPNDMDHEITDTESMFGTWTEQFLSALGRGSGSGGSGTALEQPLLTINTSNMGLPSAQQDGYTFVWDHTLNGGNGGFKWGKAGGSEDDILKSPLKEINKADLGTSTANGSLLLYRNGAWGYSTIPYLLKISDSNHSLTVDTTLTWATGTFSLDIKPLLDNYLSQDDADTRYVRKAWFDKVFKTYVGSTLKAVNDAGVIAGTTTLDNLKILVGTWTEQYISALGQGSGGGGGGTALNYPLMSINDINANPTSSQVGYTLVWNGSSWGYGTSGIDQTALSNYLTTNNYIKADSATKWWGQTMSNGIVTGDITVGDGDVILNNARSINVKDNMGNEKEVLVMNSSINSMLICRGTGTSGYITSIYGNRIAFYYGASGKSGMVLWDTGHLTIAANDIANTENATRNIFLNVGGSMKTSRIYLYTNGSNPANDVYLEYDSQNNGVHLVGAGIYTDTYVSALGAGSGGGAATGMDWEALEYYDNQHQIDIRYLDLSSYALKSEIPSDFNLQKASSTVLGGVKVGNTLEIDNSGVLNQKSGVVTVGTYFKATVDTYGRVTCGSDSLAASDIPTLTVAKISDLSLSNGVITIGSNSITPLTDAKLKNDYEWWGAKLDATTKKREGDMSNVGDISFQASGKNIGGVAYFNTTNTRLGIGAAPGNYTLDVTGNVRATLTSWFPAIELFGELADDSVRYPYIDFHYNQSSGDYTTRIIESANGVLSIMKSSGATGLVVGTSTHNDYIKIGGATIYWDANNQALHIDKGVYSDSFVSALGAGSGGSSGGGGTLYGLSLTNTTLSLVPDGQQTSQDLSGAIGMYLASSSYITGLTVNGLSDGVSVSDHTINIDNVVRKVKVNGREYSPYQNGMVNLGTISGGIDMDDVWDALYNYDPNHTINNSHLNLGSMAYADTGDYALADEVVFAVKIGNSVEYPTNGIVDLGTISGSGLSWTDLQTGANHNIGSSSSWLNGIWADYVDFGINGGTGMMPYLMTLYPNPYQDYGASPDNTIQCQDSDANLYIKANDIYLVGDDDVFANGSHVTSDIRQKDIATVVEIDIDSIGRAPIFDFTWKERKNKKLHLGTSAQYWMTVFPNAVSQMADGYYALDYGATALAAAVMTARKVLTHEEQIAALKKRIGELEQEVELLKSAA